MSQKNFMSYGDAETLFTEVGNKINDTFVGTQAQWNALTTEQKKAYKFADITDDYDDNPVGNLNALTTTDKSSCVGAINEVNGKVGNYINIMNDVTVDANISIRDSKIEAQKIGKMVFVNLMFTTQAQISANTSFIQGVPYSPKINNQSFVLYKQGTSTGYVVSLDRVSGTNTCNIVNRDVIPTGTDLRGLLSIPT